jgi:hypothetical protein
LIVNHRNLAESPEKLRRESLEFYWMQNLAVTADEASLRDVVIRFRMLVINKGGELCDGADFLSFDRALNAEPAFHKACKELATELTDGQNDSLLPNPTADAQEQSAGVRLAL